MSDTTELEQADPFEQAADISGERVCGISKDDLNTFTDRLRTINKGSECFPMWKTFRSALNRTQLAWDREKRDLLKRKDSFGIADEAQAKLAQKLKDLEGLDLTEDERRQRKLRAVVDSLDLVKFSISVNNGMLEGKVDAMKLAAQLLGLLTQQEQATTAPVFNFQVVVRGEETGEAKAIEA